MNIKQLFKNLFHLSFVFRLEVILSKAEVGLMWQELIKGDKQGEELMDPALIEEIHAKLAHLTSETEVII